MCLCLLVLPVTLLEYKSTLEQIEKDRRRKTKKKELQQAEAITQLKHLKLKVEKQKIMDKNLPFDPLGSVQ